MVDASSRAAQTRGELDALQADHARLSEQYDMVQSCNVALRHDLKAWKRSMKQVHIRAHVSTLYLP